MRVKIWFSCVSCFMSRTFEPSISWTPGLKRFKADGSTEERHRNFPQLVERMDRRNKIPWAQGWHGWGVVFVVM